MEEEKHLHSNRVSALATLNAAKSLLENQSMGNNRSTFIGLEESYSLELRMYGDFENDRLVGDMATRSEGTHIALFFVEAKYHKMGFYDIDTDQVANGLRFTPMAFYYHSCLQDMVI